MFAQSIISADNLSTECAELCLEAVRQNAGALKYVPEALREQVKQAAGIDGDEAAENEERR